MSIRRQGVFASYSSCGQVEPAGTQQVSRMGHNPARRRNLVNNSRKKIKHGLGSADLVILNPEMVFNRKERKEHKESRIQGGEGASFAHQQGEQEKA